MDAPVRNCRNTIRIFRNPGSGPMGEPAYRPRQDGPASPVIRLSKSAFTCI